MNSKVDTEAGEGFRVVYLFAQVVDGGSGSGERHSRWCSWSSRHRKMEAEVETQVSESRVNPQRRRVELGGRTGSGNDEESPTISHEIQQRATRAKSH